jgi:hypothetical protein
MVFRGRNRDTNLLYAIKISRGRHDPQVEPHNVYGDPSPALSRSSHASIVHPEEMHALSLGLKREREARTYLRYIKTGHRHICNFESWCELNIMGDWRFLHVFELCDAGTLFDITTEYRNRETFPPETFIVSNSLLEFPAASHSLRHPHSIERWFLLGLNMSSYYTISIGIWMLVADMCRLVESL